MTILMQIIIIGLIPNEEEEVTQMKNNLLQLCSINVRGIFSKLKLGIFQKYIEKFDIICLSETKNEIPSDELKSLNFTVINAKNKGNGTFGGIRGGNFDKR